MSRRYKEMQYIMSQSYHRYRRPNATDRRQYEQDLDIMENESPIRFKVRRAGIKDLYDDVRKSIYLELHNSSIMSVPVEAPGFFTSHRYNYKINWKRLRDTQWKKVKKKGDRKNLGHETYHGRYRYVDIGEPAEQPVVLVHKEKAVCFRTETTVYFLEEDGGRFVRVQRKVKTRYDLVIIPENYRVFGIILDTHRVWIPRDIPIIVIKGEAA